MADKKTNGFKAESDKSDPKMSIHMETLEFREFAISMIDYICDYLDNIRERRVLADVKPGYLRALIPDEAPEKPDTWQDVLSDVERVIMPGITHWHSPKFHAYFPAANSYPAIVADLLTSAISCSGFSWIASPACTELEVVMMDWLGKMLDLPKEFLACSGGKGGGVIQGTASEATLVALLGAKAKKIQEVRSVHPDWEDSDIAAKLIGYHSDQAHSSVERAGLLGGVKLHAIPADAADNSLRGQDLEAAIEKDLAAGLIPFYVVCTSGTTSLCAFDRLDECGLIGNKYNIWIHVDAAYAGAALICPEHRHLMRGLEYVDSFDFNPHKWLLVNFDCSAMWLKDPSWVINAFYVHPLYLKYNTQGTTTEYRHWQIPFDRRFRALKLWFVLRLYGVENLQAYIRQYCNFAAYLGAFFRADQRFEIVGKISLSLVCFRLKGANELNEKLLQRINARGNIHMVPAKIRDNYFIRMTVCSRFTTAEDIEYSWREVSAAADDVLREAVNRDFII